MATSRYNRTRTQELKDLDYKNVYLEKFDNRRKQYIKIFETIQINYPSFNEILDLEHVDHIWTMGDHYYKLAEIHYNDPQYWWVIAWFNKKPTESHVKVGDIIRVPKSIGTVLARLGF
jgi:nucleoid-associated protein YgaU